MSEKNGMASTFLTRAASKWCAIGFKASGGLGERGEFGREMILCRVLFKSA